MFDVKVGLALLSKALEDKALDVHSGRFTAGGLRFKESTTGKNYGYDAAAYVFSNGGSVLFTEEDEDMYDNIYEKAAGEYHSENRSTKERINAAQEHGVSMKRGFQTLQNFLEDRGHHLYRIQGRGNLVTTITIDPDMIVETRVNGEMTKMPAKEAYEHRQVATAEGNIIRAVNVIASVAEGDEEKVAAFANGMLQRSIAKSREKQASRVALEQILG
jgi:hypothetical protein